MFCGGTESWFWFPAGAGLAESGCEIGAWCAAQQAILPPQPQSGFAADDGGLCAQTAICAHANARLQMMDSAVFTI
jgi:hypothetical protein